MAQVLALFAAQPYDSELQDLGNLDAHLTNTCRLGEGEGQEEQAVRLLSELPQVSKHLFVSTTPPPLPPVPHPQPISPLPASLCCLC